MAKRRSARDDFTKDRPLARFTMLSVFLARHPDLNVYDRAVYGDAYSYANDDTVKLDGEFFLGSFVSDATIGSNIGISRRAVGRSFIKLARLGFVIRERPDGRKSRTTFFPSLENLPANTAESHDVVAYNGTSVSQDGDSVSQDGDPQSQRCDCEPSVVTHSHKDVTVSPGVVPSVTRCDTGDHDLYKNYKNKTNELHLTDRSSLRDNLSPAGSGDPDQTSAGTKLNGESHRPSTEKVSRAEAGAAIPIQDDTDSVSNHLDSVVAVVERGVGMLAGDRDDGSGSRFRTPASDRPENMGGRKQSSKAWVETGPKERTEPHQLAMAYQREMQKHFPEYRRRPQPTRKSLELAGRMLEGWLLDDCLKTLTMAAMCWPAIKDTWNSKRLKLVGEVPPFWAITTLAEHLVPLAQAKTGVTTRTHRYDRYSGLFAAERQEIESRENAARGGKLRREREQREEAEKDRERRAGPNSYPIENPGF